MDTPQYSNILNAINGMNAPQPAQAPHRPVLTPAEQSENYNTFSELMKQGVHLPTLLKRLDDLESKVRTLESQPKQDTNAELLAVMERAVKNDPEVKEARQKVADVKSRIISELCMQDERYKQALEDYKTTVNRVYIGKRESDGRISPQAQVETEDRGGAS
jgi:hypothetical protein